jgi:hypothetical protein
MTNTLEATLPTSFPIAHEADVMVVGGGPGGIGAAVAAAREGADVLLVEHYGFLGGMATTAEVNPFMPNFLNGRELDTGVFKDWLDRIDFYGGIRDNNKRVFDPNIARLAAEDLCQSAGVRLLYHHRPIHVQAAHRRIDGVVLHSKSGLQGGRAKIYVDSTGDGDLASMAGCRFEQGDKASGNSQPMTLCFKLKVNREDFPPELRERDLYGVVERQRDLITEAYRKAKAAGRVDCPREDILLFPSLESDVVHFNTTRIIQKSGTNGAELSQAEIEGRRQLRQIWKFLKEEVPLFRNAKLYSIAPQIGIRESRRIIGRQYLTVDDYDAARRFPDAVARVTYPIDIHNPNGTGTVMRYLPAGQWYEVPWKCLVAADLDNLAIASRCISADHATHSSLRVMAPVCSFGQAVGTAAAMALRDGIDVCDVDGVALNARLREQGRNLLPFEAPRAEHVPTAESERKLVRRGELAAQRFSA